MPVGKASRKKKGSISEVLGDQGSHERGLNPSQKSASKVDLQKTASVIMFFPIITLLLVSLAVYLNTLSANFVYDDILQIVNNPWITDIRNIPTIFSESVWSFKRLSISNYYRPMMHIVYMLNYHLFGLKPWGFHLVNILFHCGASILVFLLIRRLLTAQGSAKSSVYLSPPFIAAILFAVHPIHTEAVSWIAGLPDVAFTFFYLLSLYLYILFREGVKSGYLLSILSFSMATLFKEPAITLPIMLVAYDYLVKKSDGTIIAAIKRYIPYAVVSGVYLLVRYFALRSLVPSSSYSSLSTYQLIINVFPLFREYLTGLLWPFDLNFWHIFQPISSLFEAQGVIAVVVTAIFLVVAMAAYRKNRLLFFSLLFVVVPLAPVFYIKAINGKPFAERYLYLPSVGYVLLLAIFLSWGKEKLPRVAKSITIVFIVIVGLYAVGTITRNNVWKDDLNLWADTVMKSPDSAAVHNELGNVYVSRGLLDKAVAELQIALRLSPNTAPVHYSLANVYASQGQLDKAAAEYQSAIQLKPNFADAHNNLATMYVSQGLMDKAVAEFQTALRLNPDYAEAHDNLGGVYVTQGLLDKAEGEFQAALRLNPDYAKSHNNLATVYASQGLMDKAIIEYQSATRLKPDLVEAHYNLGNAYSSKGLFDMAIEQYQITLRLRPKLAQAHNKIGFAYASQGLLDRAIAEYQTALQLKPDFHEASQRLNDIESRRH